MSYLKSMGITMGHKMSIKGLNFTLTLVLLSCLFGCSIFDGNNENVDGDSPSAKLNYDEINQYVKEWEEAKPKVERLSALEYDLALIIKEVGKLTTLKSLPPQYADQQMTDFVEAEYDNFNAVDATKEATDVEVIRQTYAAHLAFFLKEGSAQVGWSVLKRRYPEILNNLTPVIKKVVRNKQTIYSLRVGPFDKEVGAKEVCYIFIYYKYQCEPTDFSGNAILI
jgi:hypothetical protein